MINRQGAKHAKEEFFCWKRRGFFVGRGRWQEEELNHEIHETSRKVFGSTGIPACVFSKTRAGMPVPQEFSCGNSAGSIDGDCLTPLHGGDGQSLDSRAAFVPSYTARCIRRTIAARGIIKLFCKK
jgi:hypothetical protein